MHVVQRKANLSPSVPPLKFLLSDASMELLKPATDRLKTAVAFPPGRPPAASAGGGLYDDGLDHGNLGWKTC